VSSASNSVVASTAKPSVQTAERPPQELHDEEVRPPRSRLKLFPPDIWDKATEARLDPEVRIEKLMEQFDAILKETPTK
jgi:hypothetical protein